MKKFNAKKTEYRGELFSSKFEAQCAFELDMRLASNEILSWETQVQIPLIVNDYVVGNYNIDFVVIRKDGVKEYIEAKGYAGDTPVWRLKWAILEAMLASSGENAITKIMWQGTPGRIRKIKKIQKNKCSRMKS